MPFGPSDRIFMMRVYAVLLFRSFSAVIFIFIVVWRLFKKNQLRNSTKKRTTEASTAKVIATAKSKCRLNPLVAQYDECFCRYFVLFILR